jgi:hypothetical protein|tara:strand:- start:891 stop:1091 length:201 start_codon:yes stop_codon:yes gene_type:complete
MTDRVSNNLLEALRDSLRREMNQVTDHIATGSCKDHSEYTHACGVIKGLALAEREILDLNKRLEEQ